MEIILTDTEIRVLGCLMEKEIATPDYYPLSLNGLINACNQKSNRNPVVTYDEDTVLYAISGLQERKLIRQSNLSRVAKYEQVFSTELKFILREVAIVCVLLVRGPQTTGEIRGRTERLYSFKDLEEVQETITSLESMSFIKKLPRQPGRKESRYTHLLSGEREDPAIDVSDPKSDTITVITRKKDNHIEEITSQLDELRLELQSLKEEFIAFKSQFE